MASSTEPTINTYISDMLALERHVNVPLEHQSKDSAVRTATQAARIIDAAFADSQKHINLLEARLEAVGGHGASGIKDTVAKATGAVAATIGDSRKTEVSKYLRDDYSALALVSAGYTLLHTTALALHDSQTASLAKQALADTAAIIMKISNTLPVVVLGELRAEGVDVDASVVSEAERNVEAAWKNQPSHSAN